VAKAPGEIQDILIKSEAKEGGGGYALGM